MAGRLASRRSVASAGGVQAGLVDGMACCARSASFCSHFGILATVPSVIGHRPFIWLSFPRAHLRLITNEFLNSWGWVLRARRVVRPLTTGRCWRVIPSFLERLGAVASFFKFLYVDLFHVSLAVL